MDYEHQPARGPGVWIGAGLLVAGLLVAGLLVTVGGASLLWLSQATSGELALAVAGSLVVVVGLTSAVAGIVRARRRRQ